MERFEIRICSICGKAMLEGYCCDNGYRYYCSDECLHHDFTDEEWEDVCDNGFGDSYWTDWYDIEASDDDDPYWKAVIATETEYFHLECFDTEEEATQFCEARDWKYTMADGTVYPLEVHVPIED